MRVYSSMPTSEFVEQLRDIAINAGARPQVIDAIDSIPDETSEDAIEQRIEKAVEEAIGYESDRMWERCFDTVEAGLRDRRGNLKLGIDQEQFEAIMGLLKAIKPE